MLALAKLLRRLEFPTNKFCCRQFIGKSSMFWEKAAWEETLIPEVWTIPSFYSQIFFKLYDRAWFRDVWDVISMTLWSAERLTPNSSKMRHSKRWPGHFATKTPQIAVRNEADMIWTIKRKHSSCLCREAGLHCFFDVLGVIVIQNPTCVCTSILSFPVSRHRFLETACIDFLQYLRWLSLWGSCGNRFEHWKVPDPFPYFLFVDFVSNEDLWWLRVTKTEWLAKVS